MMGGAVRSAPNAPRKGRSTPVLVFAVSLVAFLVSSILYFLFQAEFPGIEREPSRSGEDTYPIESKKPTLFLSDDNTFKLAIFSDLHFGEEEHGWGIAQDLQSIYVMRVVLKDESPHLVVINGDLITGENTFKENSSDYAHQVFSPMVEAWTPWASTYGNHDSKFNLSREATYSIEKRYYLSYTTRMDDSLPGITNYYLLLHSKTLGKPVAVLWFFDSRGGGTYQKASAIDHDDIPDWVSDEVTSWFVTTHGKLIQRYGPLPSLVFVHIPPHVFLSSQTAGLDPSLFPGINDDVPVAIQGEGAEDQKFVRALYETKNLHSVHVGHDHGNSWCSLWPKDVREATRGPFLCFGKHTGYGGYGEWNRGARIIHLQFVDTDGDGDFDDPDEFLVTTWVRMENGDIVTHVSLNETYGVDKYPTNTGEPGS